MTFLVLLGLPRPRLGDSRGSAGVTGRDALCTLVDLLCPGFGIAMPAELMS